MEPLVALLVLGIATYRLTRLVVMDAISEPFRYAVEDRFGPDSSWAYLVNCPWCASPYLAAALIGLTDLATSVPVPGLLILTSSAFAGLIATIEPE